MSVDRAMATALAERIHSSLVEAMLTWGEAVNDAEANPGDSLKKTIAQQAGLEACRLAAGVAAKLRPGKNVSTLKDVVSTTREEARARYGDTWAKHCRDTHRGCCFRRQSCVCACAKCVNVRAAALL